MSDEATSDGNVPLAWKLDPISPYLAMHVDPSATATLRFQAGDREMALIGLRRRSIADLKRRMHEDVAETFPESEKAKLLLAIRRDIAAETKRLDVLHAKRDELEAQRRLLSLSAEPGLGPKLTENRKKAADVANDIATVTDSLQELEVVHGTRRDDVLSLIDGCSKATIDMFMDEINRKHEQAIADLQDRVGGLLSELITLDHQRRALLGEAGASFILSARSLLATLRDPADGPGGPVAARPTARRGRAAAAKPSPPVNHDDDDDEE